VPAPIRLATAAARRTNAVMSEPELENPTSHDAPLIVSLKRPRQMLNISHKKNIRAAAPVRSNP